MEKLKKAALAMGNNLVYADPYQKALAKLAGENLPSAPAAPPTSATTTTTSAPQTQGPDARIVEIRRHMQRYKELVSQGKLSEAGKELDANQQIVEREPLSACGPTGYLTERHDH